MTRQEKEQMLLQLRAQENEALRTLNDSDYIPAQLAEGVQGLDEKYNNAENYPEFGGDWRAYRATQRASVHQIREEIKRVEAIEPEDPQPTPEPVQNTRSRSRQ